MNPGPFCWAEGLPPDVEQRVHESIARTKAAVRAMDDHPACSVAKAAARSAQLEGERTKAVLDEWLVDEMEPA